MPPIPVTTRSRELTDADNLRRAASAITNLIGDDPARAWADWVPAELTRQADRLEADR